MDRLVGHPTDFIRLNHNVGTLQDLFGLQIALHFDVSSELMMLTYGLDIVVFLLACLQRSTV